MRSLAVLAFLPLAGVLPRLGGALLLLLGCAWWWSRALDLLPATSDRGP